MTVKEKLQRVHDRNTKIIFDDFPNFKPDFTPIEMFWLGIFEGNYIKEYVETPQFFKFLDNINEEAKSADLSEDWKLWMSTYFKVWNPEPNKNINLFGVSCGSTLEQWQERGWIFDVDVNGWVEWYINFYYGRRNPCDARQIVRWKSFKARHGGMLRAKCDPSELDKCLKTRQNLLQWAIDSTKI